MYCCARGTFNCERTNGIIFDNLKTIYNIDEDVIVDFNLLESVRVVTRDWIGIFPRGWFNLQQYLTFEYVIVDPKTSSSTKQRLLFPRTFNREASPYIDYQFVYVSKEIEIRGTSSYFRFVLSPDPHPHPRLATLKARRPEYVAAAGGYPSTIVPVGHDDSKSSIVGPNGTTETINGIAQPLYANRLFAYHRQRMCRFCCAAKFTPTIAANRIQFLLSHNEKLVARVGRLERDLELAENTVKHEKMTRSDLMKRLEAYEVFVAEIFKSLNFKGIVKIIDKMGGEIIIRRIKPKELSNENVAISEISILKQPRDNKTKYLQTFQTRGSQSQEENEIHVEQNFDKDVLFAMRNSLPIRDMKSSEITLPIEENLSEKDKKNSRAALSAAECLTNIKSGRSSCATTENIYDTTDECEFWNYFRTYYGNNMDFFENVNEEHNLQN